MNCTAGIWLIASLREVYEYYFIRNMIKCCSKKWLNILADRFLWFSSVHLSFKRFILKSINGCGVCSLDWELLFGVRWVSCLGSGESLVWGQVSLLFRVRGVYCLGSEESLVSGQVRLLQLTCPVNPAKNWADHLSAVDRKSKQQGRVPCLAPHSYMPLNLKKWSN